MLTYNSIAEGDIIIWLKQLLLKLKTIIIEIRNVKPAVKDFFVLIFFKIKKKFRQSV